MWKFLLAISTVFLSAQAYAQSSLYVTSTTGQVGIGTTNPIVSLDVSQKTDAIGLPSGTTANRPSGPSLSDGEIRYNTSIPAVEAYVNGTWVVVGNGGGNPGISSAGRLQCGGANCNNSTGSTTISYCPYKGNVKTTASDGNYTIPSACLSATTTSMYVGGTGGTSVVANTLYYIYLLNDSGTWVLDAETTGHVTDSATGIEIMSGDDTKTLVGMVRVDANKRVMTGGTTTFVNDTNTVATWDNRLSTMTNCIYDNTRTTTSTTLTEINTENRCYFMSWGDAATFSSGQVGYSDPPAPFGASDITSVLYLDGNQSNVVSTLTLNPANSPVVVANQRLVATGTYTPSEGFHYTVVGGYVGSGDIGTYFPDYKTYVFTQQ